MTVEPIPPFSVDEHLLLDAAMRSNFLLFVERCFRTLNPGKEFLRNWHHRAIDYVLDSEFGLRYRLNQWARLSLLYELDQLRGQGRTVSDRHYLIGVGVGW